MCFCSLSEYENKCLDLGHFTQLINTQKGTHFEEKCFKLFRWYEIKLSYVFRNCMCILFLFFLFSSTLKTYFIWQIKITYEVFHVSTCIGNCRLLMRIADLFLFKLERGNKKKIQIFMPSKFLYFYSYNIFLLTA